MILKYELLISMCQNCTWIGGDIEFHIKSIFWILLLCQ